MNHQTRENWRKIKQALESAGKTDCHFYHRAVVICNGGNDPMDQRSFSTKNPSA